MIEQLRLYCSNILVFGVFSEGGLTSSCNSFINTHLYSYLSDPLDLGIVNGFSNIL